MDITKNLLREDITVASKQSGLDHCDRDKTYCLLGTELGGFTSIANVTTQGTCRNGTVERHCQYTLCSFPPNLPFEFLLMTNIGPQIGVLNLVDNCIPAASSTQCGVTVENDENLVFTEIFRSSCFNTEVDGERGVLYRLTSNISSHYRQVSFEVQADNNLDTRFGRR